MANGNAKGRGKPSVFAIQPDNSTAAYVAAGQVPEGSVLFSSEAELAAISQSWPAQTLVEIWNRLPGVTPVSKFTDRKTAIRRIWRALTSKPAGGRPHARTQGSERKTGKAKAAIKTQPAGTKTERIVALLRRPEGATLKSIMSATGWLAHSVRGFISAQVSKRMGLKVKSFKRNGERAYRIRS
jgi:hypothetical protein